MAAVGTLDRAGTGQTRATSGHCNGLPDFAKLLGRTAWNRLPQAVRARFASDHPADQTLSYVGTMHRIEASFLGRVFAHVARIFDTPVVPYTGSNVAMAVHVFTDPRTRGLVWERVYQFPARSSVTVRSTKRLDNHGQLIEALGAGLRMRLKLSEDNGAIRFTSIAYYIEIFGLRILLPRWLPPGVTHVVHTDEGEGRFRFTMYTEHAVFGTMFFQEGVFAAAEVSA